MSVNDALSSLQLNQDLQYYLISNKNHWGVFGKMNIHMYWAQLMKLAEANLDATSRFMMFFLFGVVKNRDRILKAMDQMPEADKCEEESSP